jgi:hypothetical protein
MTFPRRLVNSSELKSLNFLEDCFIRPRRRNHFATRRNHFLLLA